MFAVKPCECSITCAWWVRVRTRLGVCVQCTFPILAAVQAEINLITLKGRRQGVEGGCLQSIGSFVWHYITVLLVILPVNSTLSPCWLNIFFFQLIYSKMYGSSDNCVPYSGVLGGTYYQSQAVLKDWWGGWKIAFNLFESVSLLHLSGGYNLLHPKPKFGHWCSLISVVTPLSHLKSDGTIRPKLRRHKGPLKKLTNDRTDLRTEFEQNLFEISL